MSEPSALDKAIDIVKKAIDEDSRGNYPEALKQYQNSLDWFMLSLKFEKDEKNRSLLIKKIDEYLNRAEKLKEYLAKEDKPNSRGISGGSSTATSDVGESSKESGDQGTGAAPEPAQPPFTTTPQASSLDRAITEAGKAIEADNKGNYQEAYKHYLDALDYLMLALKYEQNPRVKSLIAKKTEEYMTRAEKLKEFLAKGGNSGLGAGFGDNGGATSSSIGG